MCAQMPMKKTLWCQSLYFLAVLALTAAGNCHATNLYFQGFESDASGWSFASGGDGNGSITQTPSGGGPLGLTAFSGANYATVHSNTNGYAAGYGTGGYSFFGTPSGIPPYPGGPFSQSINVYIDTHAPAPSNGGTPAFWVDGSPASTSPVDAGSGGVGYGGEHNFQLSYTGSSVIVNVDGTAPVTTLASSGWYTFEMVYSKGASDASLAMTTLNLYNSGGVLLGSDTTLDDSNGDPLESQYLAGPGYVWLAAWQNGFSNDELGIDDVRADTSATPEPAVLGMLASGFVGLAGIRVARRRVGVSRARV